MTQHTYRNHILNIAVYCILRCGGHSTDRHCRSYIPRGAYHVVSVTAAGNSCEFDDVRVDRTRGESSAVDLSSERLGIEVNLHSDVSTRILCETVMVMLMVIKQAFIIKYN